MPFDITNLDIQEYCDNHTTPESELLYQLNRQTHLKVMRPRMLSGKSQGMLLQMISHMIRPKRILEVGTYTGYSTLCLASGLASDGLIYTIDKNEELEEMIRTYLEKGGIMPQTRLYIGQALEVIPQLNEAWDLVFLDADKVNYTAYYELILPQMKQGSYMLADNVLWSGKVVEELKNNDKDTRAMLEFNEHVQNDPRVNNMLLPFRDGLMFIEKL